MHFYVCSCFRLVLSIVHKMKGMLYSRSFDHIFSPQLATHMQCISLRSCWIMVRDQFFPVLYGHLLINLSFSFHFCSVEGAIGGLYFISSWACCFSFTTYGWFSWYGTLLSFEPDNSHVIFLLAFCFLSMHFLIFKDYIIEGNVLMSFFFSFFFLLQLLNMLIIWEMPLKNNLFSWNYTPPSFSCSRIYLQ